MPDFSIQIEGAEETIQMLKVAPRLVVARGFLRALQAGAGVIEEALEARTPERDEGNRSEDQPHLKDSIVTEIQIDSQYRGGTAEIGFGKMGHVANFVEYGHRMIGHKPDKKELGTVEPHPFMRPAASVAAEAAIDAFSDALKAELQANPIEGAA